MILISTSARKTQNILTGDLSPHPEKNSGSETGSLEYDCKMFMRSPVGGSFVILTLFCKTVTGNCQTVDRK